MEQNAAMVPEVSTRRPPRENVSLEVVEPEEPREITEITVGGSEREEFAAFGPIEDFEPDWGDVAQASAETEQFVPDPSQFPLVWATLRGVGPKALLPPKPRRSAQANLPGVVALWAARGSLHLVLHLVLKQENSNWKRGYTTFL